MRQSIVHVAIVVEEYNEAIDFYTKRLGFELIEDTYIPEQNKRWVLVAPQNSKGTAILLAKASNPDQARFIGNQAGGRVFLFLSTDDFWRDYNQFLANGIKFLRNPEKHAYGIVAVFEDLYGNLWDLLEHTDGHHFSQKGP